MAKFTLTLVFPLLLRIAPALAQDPAPPPLWPVQQFHALLATPEPTPESRANTARLIRDLTADNYQTREAASKELAAKGPAAFPGLREAVAASKDPELIARTITYFKPELLQIPPNVPATTLALLRQYEQSRAKYMETIARMPEWPDIYLVGFIRGLSGGQAEQFYQIISAQETEPRLKATLNKQIHERAPERARLALAEGKFDKAEKILSDAMDVRGVQEDYATLLALRRGQALDPEKEAANHGLQDSARKRLTMLLYRAKGDNRQAARFAEPDPDMTSFVWRAPLIEAGEYAKLAEMVESLPNRQSYDLDHVTAYLMAGQSVRANAILSAGIEKDGAASWGGNAARLLTANDRADDAISVSQRGDDREGFEFHLFCARLQIREALASIKDRKTSRLDFPEHLVALGLPLAARELLKEFQPVDPEIDRYPYRSYLYYAGQLDLAGLPDEAAKWRRLGLESLNPAARERSALLSQVQQYKDALAKLGPLSEVQLRDTEKLQESIDSVNSQISQLHFKLDDMTFFGDAALPDISAQQEASFWFNNVLRCEPPDTLARYNKAIRIVQGRLSDEELNSLVGELLREVSPDYGWDTQARDLNKAVIRFHRANHDECTTELVQRLYAQRGDPSCWSLLGDLELMRDRPAQAVTYFQRAATMNLTDATFMYRLGLALLRADKTDPRGRQLMDYAPLLVLANYDQALALAETMRRFQGDAVADAWFEPFSRRFSNIGKYVFGNSLVIARDAAEARGDYAAALELQKKMLFSNPPSKNGHYFGPVLFLSNFAHYHRLRALDALTRKDFPTLADALDRHLNNAAPDIDLLEKTLPALRTADPAAAQKILTRALNRLQPIVQDYPDATLYHRQLTRLQSLSH